MINRNIFTQCIPVWVCIFYFTQDLIAATFTYSYDSLSRITNAAYSGGSSESYSYDSVGNRLTRVTGIFDSIPPSVPDGLAYSTNINGQIVLNWNSSQDVGTGIAGYHIYLNGNYYTNTSNSDFIFSGLFPNMAYCVTITAYDHVANVSAQSAEICLVTPEINFSANPSATISIYPTASPIGNTSPSWNNFLANAIQYLETGQGLSFDRSTPTNYVLSDHYEVGDILGSRTNTPLWRGQFNQPSPFNNEVGNKFRFSLKVTSATPFNLTGVEYELSSSDPSNGFGFLGGLGSQNYNLAYSGLWYGPDGIKGTADDVWRTSGAGNLPVNELYYVGTGNYFYCDSQDDINNVTNFLASNYPFSFKLTYNIYGTNGQRLASAFRVITPFQELPAKILKLSAPNGNLDFGTVNIGSTTNLTFIVTNAALVPITICGVGCPYGFSCNWPGGVLSPGSYTNVTITFCPDILVSYGGAVTIYSDATIGADIVPVSGSAIGNSSAKSSSVTITPTPGPNNLSPSFTLWRNNLIRFLETGVGSSPDRSAPTNVTFPNMVDVGDIFISTNPVTLWRGQLYPPPPFTNEIGNFVYFPLKVVSAIPFNLNSVRWDQRDTPAYITPYVGKMTNLSYSASVVGIYYGADGIKGTADDVIITSGSSTQLVNELYYRGVGSSFYGNSQTQIQNVHNHVASISPYYHVCTWSVAETNGDLLASSSNSILVLVSLPISPPILTNPTYQPSGQFALQISGTPGLTYEVWGSTNLFDWQYLTNLPAQNVPASWIDMDTGLYDHRYYRLQTGTNSNYHP